MGRPVGITTTGAAHTVIENGDAGERVTTRTFDYGFDRRILDKVKSETVTVGLDLYMRLSQYARATGFLDRKP